MRVLILGTLLCPLYIGMLLVLLGVDQSLAAGALQFQDRPWIVFCGPTVLASVTLFFLSRRLPSELAFRWLFFFGLFCLGLALAETLRESARTYPWDPYDHAGYKALSYFLPVDSTLAVGLAHIIAALIRDFYFHVLTRKGR